MSAENKEDDIWAFLEMFRLFRNEDIKFDDLAPGDPMIKERRSLSVPPDQRWTKEEAEAAVDEIFLERERAKIDPRCHLSILAPC